ncbi:hypothetical protein AND4_12332 [Vibrio sp. AND4]|nr:hypothetical protein AND4_12332 [Vibrio sp. AND4]
MEIRKGVIVTPSVTMLWLLATHYPCFSSPKGDISTWEKRGHFKMGLTVNKFKCLIWRNKLRKTTSPIINPVLYVMLFILLLNMVYL